MSWEANLRDAYRIGVEFVTKEKASLPIVFVGGRGRGKGELLELLKNKFSGGQQKICVVKCLPIPDVRLYEPLILLADQVSSETDSTIDDVGILEIFRKFALDGNRLICIVEDLNNMAQSTLGLFLRILNELASFSNVKFIASAFEDENHVSKTVTQLETISSVDIVHILPPEQEDMEFALKEWGYKLPEEVVETLFLMTDANIEMVRYSLLYYESIGYIDSNKGISNAMLRYVPVPPTMDSFFEVALGKLSPEELGILYLVLAMQGSVTGDQMYVYTGIPKEKVSDILSELIKKRMITVIGNFLLISSLQFMDFLNNSTYNVTIDRIAETIVKTGKFDDLPPSVALMFLVRSGDADKLMTFLKVKGEKILFSLTSHDTFIHYLEDAHGIIGPEGESIIRPLICTTYYVSGRIHESISCIDSYFRNHKKIPALSLLKGSGLLGLGNITEAMAIAKEVETAGGSDKILKLRTSLLMGSIQLASRDYTSAEVTFENTLNLAKEIDDPEGVTTSLNALGRIELERFSLDKAEKYFNETLETARVSRSYGVLLTALNNLAITNDYRGNYTKAVELYKEVVDLAVFVGDIRFRARAAYNLFESYETIGERWVCKNYMEVGEKLINLVEDRRLSYLFYRSVARFYILDMEMGKALEYAEKAIPYAVASRDEQWIDVAHGLKAMIQALSGKAIDPESMKLLVKEYPRPEDFMPYYYGLSGLYLELAGMKDMRKRVFGNLINYGKEIKEYAAKFASSLVQSVSDFLDGNPEEGIQTLKRAMKRDSGIAMMRMISELIEVFEGESISEIEKSIDKSEEIIKRYSGMVSPMYMIAVLFLKMNMLRLADQEYDLSDDMGRIKSMHPPEMLLDHISDFFGVAR